MVVATHGEAAPDVAQELLALKALNEFQHQELVIKLEHRFASLEQMLSRSWHPWQRETTAGSAGGPAPVPSKEPVDPSVTAASQEVQFSHTSSQQGSQQGSQQDSRGSPGYISFASFDKQLKHHTDTADGHISRKKFAHQKTKSTAEGQKRGCWVDLVNHPGFDAFFGFVVITNAVFIGIDMEMSLASGEEYQNAALRLVQYGYTFLFTVELIMRISAAEGTSFFWTEDWHWNYLDIFIVASSLWEVVVGITHLIWEQNLGTLSGVSSLKAFRIIRITRVVKTVRVIRLFRFVLKLRTLITSIASTLSSLFWAMILLALVIYVFAILFAQTVNDAVHLPDAAPLSERDHLAAERYFRDLPTTMLSLFMSIAGGVSWEEVIAPLMSISPLWAWIFLFYFFFTYFAVLNVVTAVFCQSAIDSAQSDHTMMVQSILDDKEAHLEKIRMLFSKMACDEGGGITFSMFEEKINSAAVKEYFATLGLDVWDAWSFFKLLDADAGGSVEIEEFLMGCLRLRGQATAIDVGKIMQDQHWLITNQDRFFGIIDAELRDLKMELASLRFWALGPDASSRCAEL